jgi:hypothetical protein
VIRAALAPAALIVLLVVALAPATACDSSRFLDAPAVQASAEGEARHKISLNRVVNGRFRAYAPRCNDAVRNGDVVEFRNFLPEVATNVTSISAPDGHELYSPNLVRPYNYVSADDEDNDVCDATDAEGECTSRPPFSFWRHAFTAAGVYDWVDTNQGAPGRKIVDPYYGTETFVGLDPDTPIATICVPDELGAGCDAVCCATDADCEGDNVCNKLEGEATGRCLLP